MNKLQRDNLLTWGKKKIVSKRKSTVVPQAFEQLFKKK